MGKVKLEHIFDEGELLEGAYPLLSDVKRGWSEIAELVSYELVKKNGWWLYYLLVFSYKGKTYSIYYKEHASPISADDEYLLDTLQVVENEEK